MKFGDFELAVIRECEFRLDGGAMYGVVPKLLWNKVAPADELNRVRMNCNLLLIETPSGRVLVETGMGSRWNDRDRERYALKTFVDSSDVLASIGLKNSDVDFVIVSHLHFDHVGGALIEQDGKLAPAFPNARYVIQKGEWEFAHKCNARAKGSYRFEDFELLKELDAAFFVDGDAEIVPGVTVRVTGGHTSHHQMVHFESQGEHGVYFADIIPTASHLHPPWVMGYDHFPLASCDYKSEWLARASKERWLVVFDHEPGVPWGYVRTNEKGRFEFEPLPAESLHSGSSNRISV